MAVITEYQGIPLPPLDGYEWVDWGRHYTYARLQGPRGHRGWITDRGAEGGVITEQYCRYKVWVRRSLRNAEHVVVEVKNAEHYVDTPAEAVAILHTSMLLGEPT